MRIDDIEPEAFNATFEHWGLQRQVDKLRLDRPPLRHRPRQIAAGLGAPLVIWSSRISSLSPGAGRRAEAVVSHAPPPD